MAYSGQTIKQMVQLGSLPDDCWEWLGSRNKRTGYGKKTVSGKSVLAHRWMYEALFGRIPEGKVINHLCGNKGCVNPRHLEAITQAANCRHGAGTKLTRGQAQSILNSKAFVTRGGRKIIAKAYGISPQLVSDIWYGRAWKDLEPVPTHTHKAKAQ